MKCPKCGRESAENDSSGGWYCEPCDIYFEEPPAEPREPDYNGKSFREVYIETWHEHRRLHR